MLTQLKRYAGCLAMSLSLAASVPAIAGPQFLAYEGGDAVHVGQGGDKKVIDGVDFWIDGSPPRRFRILGALTDERWASGLVGVIRMSGLEHDIAKLAREKGGDAVILQDSHNELRGVVGSTYGSVYGNRYGAFGSATTVSRPLESHAARYLVVLYLPDEPSASGQPPSVAPAAQQPAPPVSQLQSTKPTSASAPTGGIQVSLQRAHGVLLVPVLVNGAIELQFMVDSGAADVSIPADVFLTLVRTGTIDASDYIGKEIYTLADGSTVPSATFRIRKLKVGDREVDNVTASVANDPRAPLLLGQSFLQRFSSWSIDNQRGVLILGSNELQPQLAADHPKLTPKCGVIQMDDGAKIIPCGPAQSALR